MASPGGRVPLRCPECVSRRHGELADALSFADAATALLLHLRAGTPARGLPEESLTVREHRAEVHQVTGVVSVQAAVSLQHALLMTHARAYAGQRPIGTRTYDVLNGVVDLSDDLDS